MKRLLALAALAVPLAFAVPALANETSPSTLPPGTPQTVYPTVPTTSPPPPTTVPPAPPAPPPVVTPPSHLTG